MRKLLLLPITVILLFFTANAQVNDNLLAQQLVTKNADSIGLSKNDLTNYIVSSSYFNEPGNTQMVYLNQSYKGLPVYNQMLVLAFKNGILISKAGSFLANMENLTNGAGATPIVSPADAVRTSISDAKANVPTMVVALNTLENGKKYNFGKLNIAAENITAELMWVPVDDGKNITAVKLAWQVQLYLDKKVDYLHIRVDANTNAVVNKNSLTVFENFDQFNPRKINTIKLPAFMMQANTAKQKTFTANQASADQHKFLPLSPSLVGTANYTVIPYPAESPIHAGGTAAVRTNPWTLAGGNAVTLGWHNDGTADYTTSRGNNVYAQEDRDNNNTTFGITANSTTTPDPLNFTYAGQPDYTVAPITAGFQQFALTNLFYWNNLLHDLTYNYGFTEPAGNFQNNNQGRGGAQADYVIADGQDAGGTNNANMSTPADGARPRMQMYLWDPVRSVTTMNVNTPATISGPYNAIEGAFSPANLLANVGPVTAQVVWYNDDAAGNTHYACNAPANSITGKIALISRGFGGAVCTATVPFTVKVKNAQDAGAVAVIMVNNVPGAPIVMGGGPDPTIIIPAVMISDVDGAIIAAQLGNNVNVTLSGTAAGTIQLDGDIDNGIIAHEFFHGVSNRLTGGPANVGCLGNTEQAGEGWSDYMALMITTNWATATINDGFNIKRPIGNYAFGYPITGPGIRAYPYCTNLAINPLTYNDLPAAVIPHGVGTVFCTAIWEMTWQLIQTAGISSNVFNASGTGGNVIAFKLVMEGLKLQPCSPGFLDARNAILQADVNLYGGAHTCAIWTAFAKRGMGFSAVQGSSNNNGDQTPAFDMPPSCTTAAPNVTINQAAAQPDPTSTSPINFTVVFDQAVTGFATGDVTLSGTAGATTATVTGSGATYNVAVTGMSANGTVIATIAAGVCQNASAQTNNASTSTDNTVTWVITANPNVTINQAAAQPDPTSTSPINFTVVFDQVVTGFATGDVTLSGTAGATTGTVTGSGTTYNVAVTGMSANGTVIATVPAGVAINAASQPNNASTSTDNTVTWSTVCIPPTVNPVPNQQLCAGAATNPVNFTSTPAGATFAWTNSAPSIGLPASGTGNIASFITVNNTAAPVVATITVTPTIGGASSPVTIPLNAQTGTFGGSARGYFFTAPTAFTMTALRVPTDASAGNQHIAVVRFNGATPPPAFPTTTNAFTTLFLTQNNVTAGNIPVNIPIAAGDVIGILGTRGADINSYSLPPNVTTIAGFPVTLTRMGMQFPLATTAPQQLWTEAASISRIFFDYTTGTAGGCSGPPSTFTITVNPNPQVVIIADPGTTICEGDPTRLTVVLGTSTPVGTLYTQGTNPAANGSPSQVFEPANAAFTSQSADDFTVPAGTTWSVTQVTAGGIGAGAPTSVNVFFYNNSGSNLPGTVVASYPNVATFVNAGGNYTVTLPSALALTGGTYWVSVQVNMSFATGGQWFWGNFGTTNIGNQYAWQNPGGGFGTPCTSWGYGAT
ncbi:MAG: M36 family metallopeptidase, partial [Ferruginibacter sp.]